MLLFTATDDPAPLLVRGGVRGLCAEGWLPRTTLGPRAPALAPRQPTGLRAGQRPSPAVAGVCDTRAAAPGRAMAAFPSRRGITCLIFQENVNISKWGILGKKTPKHSVFRWDWLPAEATALTGRYPRGLLLSCHPRLATKP